MTKKEYRAAIAALGLSQLAAAEFLGISPRTSRRWAAGDDPPDPRAEMVLRIMLEYKMSVAAVDKLMGRKDT
jgi:DNA-binding transcriptional regulator YiaG